MCIIYPSRARPWRSTSTLVLRSCRVFVLVQSRPMKKSCPSKGACFSKAHNNIHAKSCVSKFCLGRRTKQPEVDKPLSVAHVVKLLSPYGKFHRSTNCKILRRQQDHKPPSRINHVTSPSSQSLSSGLATRSETLRNVNERLGPKADIE